MAIQGSGAESGHRAKRTEFRGEGGMLRGSATADVENREVGTEKRQSGTAALVELGLQTAVELFHNETRETFARVEVNGHMEILPCGGKNYRHWLGHCIFEESGRPARPDELKAAINVIEAEALYHGPQYTLHNRIASYDGAIWYDLSDRQWRAIKITVDGPKTVPHPPIVFRRHAHQCPQVEPVPGGDLRELLKFINVRDPIHGLLLLVHIVTCLVPTIPHPILVLFGPQGAAKTTAFRLLRRLVDPSATETMSFPRNDVELVQQLSHNWAPMYDNVTRVHESTSDILCRASTGEGFSKRKLYSDDDDVIYRFRRCVGLNGINVAAQKADLLDRSILIGLEPIAVTDRKTEEALLSEFELARPRLLGAALDLLAKAMAIRPSVHLTGYPRMADFAHWGCAIAIALGEDPAQFLTALNANSQTRNDEVLLASPIATCVLALMEKQETWEGTATELLAELERLAADLLIETKARNWPKAPHAMMRMLNEVRSDLSAMGINVESDRTGTRRTIRIQRIPENSVTSVISVIDKPTSPSAQESCDASRPLERQPSHEASLCMTGLEGSSGGCDGSDAYDASFRGGEMNGEVGLYPEELDYVYNERVAIAVVDGGVSEARAHELAADYLRRSSQLGDGANPEADLLPKADSPNG